jgi:hypothetical protein
MRAVGLLCLGLGLACARPPERTVSPARFAERFLAIVDSLHLEGLPNDGQLQALEPHLDRPLVDAFRRAAAAQEAFVAAHPDDKPPLIEGSLFSSLFEGPTAHTVGAVDSSRDSTRVTIAYARAEPGQPDTVRWTDVLVLRRRGGGFAVADLEYRAEWGFKPGPSLLVVLRAEGTETGAPSKPDSGGAARR